MNADGPENTVVSAIKYQKPGSQRKTTQDYIITTKFRLGLERGSVVKSSCRKPKFSSQYKSGSSQLLVTLDPHPIHLDTHTIKDRI